MSEKKEYIERGALLLALGEKRAVLNGLSEYGYLQVIREAPAADVEPVVRGEWKWVESGVWICTHCKTRRYTNTSRYCPECGAHMERSGSGIDGNRVDESYQIRDTLLQPKTERSNADDSVG